MGAIATGTVDTTERLAKLRELLKKPENNVKAFVVPSEDQRMYIYKKTAEEIVLNIFALKILASILHTQMNVGLSSQVSMAQPVRGSCDLMRRQSDIAVGCAIITLRDAFLFTDGRYFLQASQQLDRYCLVLSILPVLMGFFLSNWKLMKQGLPGIVDLHSLLSLG